MSLDDLDFKVVQQLMRQGRMTWSELAGILGLSAPATADRVRRLEERQIIEGYTAVVNPEAVGCGLTAFVAIALEHPRYRQDFLQLVETLPEIQECHHIAGEDDYWLKIRCAGTKELERVISDDIKGLSGILRTRTTIVLSTVKETVALPLKPPIANP